MNRLKAKERYYAVRVSKGPFCPDDLFRDIWDKSRNCMNILTPVL